MVKKRQPLPFLNQLRIILTNIENLIDYPLHFDKETLSRQLLSVLRNIRIEPPALLVTKLQQMLQWILRVSIAQKSL